MFESIKIIGEALLSQDQLSFDIAPLKNRRRKGEELLLARVIFDLDGKKLDCDPYLRCDKKSLREFLWVGNARGQKPQLVLTTDNPEYLLNPDRRNKWAIGQILKEIDKRRLLDGEIRNLYNILREIKKVFFTPPRDLTKELMNTLKEKAQREKIVLYTVSVKKKLRIIDLVRTSGYQKFLEYVLYQTGDLVKGRCHICGEEKLVLFEPAYPEGSILCIYNIDKIGFASDLGRSPESLLRTHAICVDCKKKLRLGLRYIERELQFNVGRLNMFVIPTLIGVDDPSKVFNILPRIREFTGLITAYENLKEIEEELDGYRKWLKGEPFTYIINVLFGRSKTSHFIYQHLIQNVPVTRLIKIGMEFVRASKEFAEIFTEDGGDWKMNFAEIYGIFPLRVYKESVEWKPIVKLFDAMLSDRPYPVEEIIKRAVLFAKVHRFGIYENYNISPAKKDADRVMCKGLLKHILLLNVLRNVGVVKMSAETIKEVNIPDQNIKRFLEKQRFGEWQSALFLLGALIGKIGAEQYKKGDEKKSVLDKIGFEGTSADRVKVLANYVLKGLRDYRILNAENEKLYGCMKMLLDRNLSMLRNPIDNTFYLLSGYAYITMKTITSGGGV